MLELVFWIAAGLLVYTHVGYPVLLRLLARREQRVPAAGELPSVSLIVAAHDEEEVIDRRVQNARSWSVPCRAWLRRRIDVMRKPDSVKNCEMPRKAPRTPGICPW